MISPQAFPFVWYLVRVCVFHHHYCFMYPQHVFFHGLVFLLAEFCTMTRSYCCSCTCSQRYSPCASATHPMICSCPLVMSKPIYQDNLVGYQKSGDAYSLHHTDPAIPVHQSARFHKSHPHWHLWSENMGRFNLS